MSFVRFGVPTPKLKLSIQPILWTDGERTGNGIPPSRRSEASGSLSAINEA